ncbi:MAG: hypothetical protein KDK53_24490 [Maritimibacter sp.]|nr:hypothetical protein [Maritimibacter sp.]
MIAFVKRLWAAAPVATLLLAAALAAAVLFGVRAGMLWSHRHERVAREQPVAAWMTPGLIAHSWHVPREVILDALDAPERPPKGPMNLAELAALNGTTPEALIAEAETAIAAWRAAHPEPPEVGDNAPPAPPPPAEGGAE